MRVELTLWANGRWGLLLAPRHKDSSCIVAERASHFWHLSIQRWHRQLHEIVVLYVATAFMLCRACFVALAWSKCHALACWWMLSADFASNGMYPCFVLSGTLCSAWASLQSMIRFNQPGSTAHVQQVKPLLPLPFAACFSCLLFCSISFGSSAHVCHFLTCLQVLEKACQQTPVQFMT